MPLLVECSPGVSQQTTLRGAKNSRVGIGHALVDNCSSREVCSSIISHAKRGGSPAYVITPNAQHIVLLDRDAKFRQVYARADLVLPDGMSLLLAARLHGRVLQERIAGVDIFHELCGLAAEAGLRVFLLGGGPGSAELACTVLRAEFQSLKINTYCPPLGFEKSAEGLNAVADAVQAVQPHLLFVGLGAPKQEYWIYEHGLRLSVPICVGVGGSFEMVSGVVPRAPGWVQRIACEWLYRLCREPRRLWRRYIIGNAIFTSIVLKQRVRRTLLAACVRVAARDGFGAELAELALLEGQAPSQLLSALTPHVRGQVRDSSAA